MFEIFKVNHPHFSTREKIELILKRFSIRLSFYRNELVRHYINVVKKPIRRFRVQEPGEISPSKHSSWSASPPEYQTEFHWKPLQLQKGQLPFKGMPIWVDIYETRIKPYIGEEFGHYLKRVQTANFVVSGGQERYKYGQELDNEKKAA